MGWNCTGPLFKQLTAIYMGQLSLAVPGSNGTVFKLTLAGVLTTLHSFNADNSEGFSAAGGLIQGTDGNLYGTAEGGGAAPKMGGTILQISLAGKIATLHSFTGTDGSGPYAGLVESADGSLYGTTRNGGASGLGTVFRLAVPSLTPAAPTITSGGIVPVDGTTAPIQPGEWVSIFGSNLASSTATWIGNFPTSLGGTSVKINGKSAYLWYVSPTQINLQAPDDMTIGSVPVAVTTAGGTTTATVTLAQFAPSFLLLDSTHVTGIIPRSNGTGAYGGGTYDIIGPTGSSLGYATVAAKAGDTIELFAVGLGPTNPTEPAGQALSNSAMTTNPVTSLINKVSVTPSFAGLSAAGLYQINLTVPAGLGTGDVPLAATVGGAETRAGAVFSLQ